MVNPRRDLDEILTLVYDDLRSFASSTLRSERSDHTLQTTALVHETYLRLAQLREIDWASEDDVLRAAVGCMRRVLIDFARAKKAKKRDVGHLLLQCPTGKFSEKTVPPSIDILALDEALGKLRDLDPEKAEVVELRYFGGQRIEDVGRLLRISSATVKRHWSFAKAWLYRELRIDSECQSEGT